MKVLFLSNLYPNSKEPSKATFNRQKAAYLSKKCEMTIVAPIQWFPAKPLFDKKEKQIPFKETIDGLEVYHPKVFYTPKLFRFLYGAFYYLSVRSLIKDLNAKHSFDVIYSSWVYPDGFAAMKLAKVLAKPFIVEALGSDIKVYGKTFLRRRIIKKLLSCADKIVAVSKDLKQQIAKLGLPEEKIEVVYSGIDHNLFSPLEKEKARESLNQAFKGKIIVFIGNLVKIKGIRYLLEALAKIKYLDYKLFIIGKGRLKRHLKKQIKRLKLQEKVEMIGPIPHQNMPLWINASDLLCLPSLSEGVPNVVLEAFACGRPVVASRVGGVGEVISDEKTGLVTEAMDSRELADKLEDALAKIWDKDYIRSQVLKFSWERNSCELFKLLESAYESN